MMALINSLPLSPSLNYALLTAHLRKNPSQWKAAVEFLKGNDLMNLSLGRHEITFDGVYANVEEYVSKIESVFETHRKYIDIQFFKSADGYDKVLADKDNFVVLFPSDAHQPCMAFDGKPCKIRKVVVKVPVK